jgi:CheY-like chemotaxis protein
MTHNNPSDPPRVLLVEDDARILSLRGSMLQQRGCEVAEVSNAGDARKALEASPRFDLVVVDINLGDGPDDRSGIDLARLVRKKYADLPIVAYSAAFSEHELTDEENSRFDRIFARGAAGVEDLDVLTDWMVKLARDRRRADAK